MNKRGRDAQRKGEGLPPNSENADGFELRVLQHQLQRTNINATQNNNNKKNDAKSKDQKFHGTNLPCFFNLVPAEAKLKELNTSRNAKYRMFAFDRNAEGAKMFVIGQLEDFTAICFHRKTSNKFKGYNYEVLMDDELMKLYCDCEYLEADNPGKNKDRVLSALLYYICQAYQQVSKPKTSSVNLDTEDFLVETCHRDGKVSYHVKIPEKFGVVTSMSAQRAFWSHVVTLANNDLKSKVNEDRVRAEEVRVLRNWKGKPFEDWVVDFSVYKDHSQCFRNLKAAKHPKQGQSTRPQDYLVPLGKSLQDITEECWKESLIMNVSSKARTLEIPKEWFTMNKNTQRKNLAIQIFNSEIHRANANAEEDVRRVEMDDNQFNVFSSLLKAIDPQWVVAEKNLLQVCYGYLNPKVDILPKYVYLFPRTKYCPIKKLPHNTCCSWLKLSQDGTMITSCFSSNHGSKPNYEIHSHEDKILKEKEAVMIETWGVFKWGKALNSRYAFMKNPPTSSKCIVEYYQNSIEYHNTDHLANLFVNCRAYSLQHPPGKRNEPSAQPEDPDRQQQPQKVLKFTNPFKCWLHAANRRDINKIIFAPNVKDCSGDINTWQGFAVAPKHSNNPCPKLLCHIRTVLTSNNSAHYEYLLNWLTWIVQRPERKTGVAVVFVSDQGTGKSTLVNVLQKIFGVHSLQITNSQHLFSQFSAHMDNSVLIVLNESTWGGDKAHEGWVKAAITDTDSLSQAKYGEIKSIKNYWNLMFVSNHVWCFPATEDNRRFFCPTVSNQRIGDHQYFNELHHELENGGVEEFLYFLMNRQIPNDWTPAQFLPNRTRTHFEALMEDRRNGALKWFIDNLRQNEWAEYLPVIYDDQGTVENERFVLISKHTSTDVPSGRLQKVWSLAREHNSELRHANVKDIKQLKNFFERLLDNRKDLFKYCQKTEGNKKIRCYQFGSMENIRKYITEIHGYDDWGNDDDEDTSDDEKPRPPKKVKSASSTDDARLTRPKKLGLSLNEIGEDSNHSDRMSLAYSESGSNVGKKNNNNHHSSLDEDFASQNAIMEDIDEDGNQHVTSDEEFTSQHALMDSLEDVRKSSIESAELYSRMDE